VASSATTWVKFATGAILSITVSWLITACDATLTEKNVSVAQEADQQSPPHETNFTVRQVADPHRLYAWVTGKESVS